MTELYPDHVPLEQITRLHWVVYLGSKTDCHGWAHVLFGDEQTEKLILCAHSRTWPGGMTLSGVNARSVYWGDTATGLAERMKFWDPRKEASRA